MTKYEVAETTAVAIVCVMLCVLVVALCWPHYVPAHGVVMGKSYSPESFTFIPMKIGDNMTLMPLVMNEAYYLRIKEDGTGRMFNVNVTEKTYDAHNVGDTWERK